MHCTRPSARRTLLPSVMRWNLCLTVIALALTGCEQGPETPTLVARVHDAVLTESALEKAMNGEEAPGSRAQRVEEWIESELLYQEALRLGLGSVPAVQERLDESERTILVDALVTRLYEEGDASPTDAELADYFESSREQFRILEPYLLVHFIETPTRQAALDVRRQLRQAPEDDRPALFDLLAIQYATDPELSYTLASNYWPLSRLFMNRPAVRRAVEIRRPPDTGTVLDRDSTSFYLRVVGRAPAGALPELAWVTERVRMQHAVFHRKQVYDQQVQKLRMEAQARGVLEIAN